VASLAGETKTSAVILALPSAWNGSIRVIPVAVSPVKAFRGQGKLPDRLAGSQWTPAAQCGATLLHKDPEFQAIDALAQEWLAW